MGEFFKISVYQLLLLTTCTPLPSLHHDSLKEFPLTSTDLELIKHSSNQDLSISTTSHNQTKCILTSQVKSEDSKCTWRSEQKCSQVPKVGNIPVFSPWCIEEENGIHLSNCKETTRTEPIEHKVKICSLKGKKICSGPCYNCPTFCKPNKQTWCEDSHELSTEVSTLTQCEGAQDISSCHPVNRRLESDVVKIVNHCYQKEVDECAPLNCKFVNITEDCHESSSTMLVQLTQRNCTVCEPSIGRKVSLDEVCHEELTDDCQTDPLKNTWKKFCSGKQDTVDNNFAKESTKDHNVEEIVRSSNAQHVIKQIYSQSLAPVENLVIETLRKIKISDLDKENPVVIFPNVVTGSNVIEKEVKKLDELEDKIFAEELELIKTVKSQPTNINLNVKYEIVDQSKTTTTSSKSSVYFDPILQIIDTQIDSGPSPTEIAEFRTPSPVNSLPNPLSVTPFSQPITDSHDTTIITKDTSILVTSPPVELTTQTTTTTSKPTTTISVKTTTQTVTIRITPKTKTTTRVPKKLSAADYFKLCFSSGKGCDFSLQNDDDIVVEEDDNSLEQTSTEPTTTTTVTLIREELTNTEDKLRARVQMCFVLGICNDADIAKARTTPAPTTTSRIPAIPTRHSARDGPSEKIRERIRMQAYLCFSEGKCN